MQMEYKEGSFQICLGPAGTKWCTVDISGATLSLMQVRLWICSRLIYECLVTRVYEVSILVLTYKSLNTVVYIRLILLIFTSESLFTHV